MGFKEDFAKFTQPSQAREDFIFKSIISNMTKDQLLSKMKPITVKRPDGATISYKVLPDYISIQNIRVPMSGNTAQKVANYFGLNLPTAAIAKEIYQNADVKIEAKPLSGSGTNVGGRQYSGQDVVDAGVGYSPFALNYNAKINKQLSDKGVKQDQIVSGFAKDIIAPPAPGKLGLYGLFDSKGKPIQGGSGQTSHDTQIHSEYGSFVRLVSPDATITYPDGRTEVKPLDSVYNYTKYNVPSTSKSTQIAKYEPGKPQSGRIKFLQRIDNLLSQLSDIA